MKYAIGIVLDGKLDSDPMLTFPQTNEAHNFPLSII